MWYSLAEFDRPAFELWEKERICRAKDGFLHWREFPSAKGEIRL